MKKVTIIGAGNVGTDSAAAVFRLCNCKINLVDKVEGLAEGKSMDIRQSSNLVTSFSILKGSSNFEDLEDSDFIVITAGAPRKSGMSRLDLLNTNKEIVLDIGRRIAAFAPRAITVIITNPVDLLTYFFKQSFPELNVFGFGCSLDSYRYRYFIVEKLHVNPSNVAGLMIGTHNPDMVPYIEGTSVGGVPVTELLSTEDLDTIKEKTINAGTNIVKKLKKTGSSYTAGQIVARMTRSVISEVPDIFSVDALLNGEMGFSGIPMSLPCIVGKTGIEKIIPVPETSSSFQKLQYIEKKLLGIINPVK